MTSFDPVTLEVVGNYLVSTVREMGSTLMRTAYSVVLREQMDCTTALFDPTGQLIAQADHVPSHQGTLSYAARWVSENFVMEPEDVVILNHPYRGGTHHPDIMIFKPVSMTVGRWRLPARSVTRLMSAAARQAAYRPTPATSSRKG